MKQTLIILTLLTLSFLGNAQGNWKWTEMAPLPLPTANNAVCEVVLGDNKFVYSFGGITGSLTQSDIHKRVFKYQVSQDTWTEVGPIPDTLGKISSAASFVNNKIYLIGGKYVEANGTETSSNKVHIYDPSIDIFESNGAPIPIPVDNHVQAVWKDSLIFIVTGWSNTSNVPDVQIYNPYMNSWSFGSSTPNLDEYKSFGASGYILGDTIFYLGGASDFPVFEAKNILRKGVINPNDPTQIDWTIFNSNNGEPLYRGACSGHGKTIFWIGGAKEAYNYEGLSFYTNLPVKSNKRTLELDLKNKVISILYSNKMQVMDLRGVAKLGGGNWIVAGGIDSLQQATRNTYLLHNPKLSDIDKANKPPFLRVIDNGDYFVIMTKNVGDIVVYDIQGRTLFESKKQLADLKIHKSYLQQGMLLFVYNNHINLPINIKKTNP